MNLTQRVAKSAKELERISFAPFATSRYAVATLRYAVIKQAWRHALRRPLQSLFFVLGVAIGVAMIVAIDLANGSAQRAFTLGTQTITGRATYEITGGPDGLDESIYRRLRVDAGFRMSAPVVEDYVTAVDLDGQPMRLLGVDPFAEPPFRAYLNPGDQSQAPAAAFLASLMTQPNTVLLSQDVAQRYAKRVGDTTEYVLTDQGRKALQK